MISCKPVSLAGPFLVVLLSVAWLQGVHRQSGVPEGFEDTLVAEVPSPTGMAITPDGRILITSQFGQLFVYQNGVLLDRPALDIGPITCANRERGLLSVAVDPSFGTNGFIYVTYILNKYGDCAEEGSQTPIGRVSRFHLAGGNAVDLDSEQILIDNIPSPVGVHNVGAVRFGPDGYLYVTVGDGGCDYAQNSGCFDSNDATLDMNALVGKVLRITRDGDIPAGNPFTGPGSVRCHIDGGAAPGETCQEIFAFGLRNPWRIAFDPNSDQTRFFINDVGQDNWEEINEGVAGANYGWNAREGFCVIGSLTDCSPDPPPGLVNPIHAYSHQTGCGSITGGAFVPRGIWPAEFDGAYLFTDFVCGRIFRLVRAADGSYTSDMFIAGLGDWTAIDLQFGDDGSGPALYYLTFALGGQVRRVTHTGTANRKPLAQVAATPLFGTLPLTVDFDGSGSRDPEGGELTFEWDFGDGSNPVSGPTAQHAYAMAGVYNATLKVTDPEGATGTAAIRIDAGNTPPQPVIRSPSDEFRFAVGDKIVLQGQATDAEDGELTDASLTWRVLLHHNTHTHPFFPPTNGNGLALLAPAPENLEAAAASFLEIELTATDSNGLKTTVSQALMPLTVEIQFLSNPPGAKLRIDNELVTTPMTFSSWVNYGVSVSAESQPAADGRLILFDSWSDGAAASHTIVAPASPATYTATFTHAASGGVHLPGKIEAENFDDGGEGVSYHDNSIGNNGGVYRDTDVDIAQAADAGGGYTVGWAGAGEWLAYSVTVSTSAAYDLDFRVASAGSGGRFHLEVDGVDITGPIVVPDTGDWQTWTTIRKPGVSLTSGEHVLRLVMDEDGATGAVGNFNWFAVQPADASPPPPPPPPPSGGSTPYGGAPVALPGTIEAENFDEGGAGIAYQDDGPGNNGGAHRATDVDVALASDIGGGYTLGWVGAGEWLQYTVSVAAAGTYDFEFRVASAGPGGTFHVELDGVDVTGPLAVPDTGDWQTWTTIRRAGVSLTAGQQVLRLVMDTDGQTGAVANFNWIRVLNADGTPPPPPPPPPASTPFNGVAVVLPGLIEAEHFDVGGAGVAYHDQGAGNNGGAFRDTDVDIAAAVDAGGGYTIAWVGAGEWLNYSVDVDEAGVFFLDVRLASVGAGGTFHIEVDGVDATGPISVPDTGAWQAWTTVRTSIELPAGPQVWRIVMDTNGASGAVANFNWLRLSHQ